jgi:O-antigen/teichoic acid export membrane protein
MRLVAAAAIPAPALSIVPNEAPAQFSPGPTADFAEGHLVASKAMRGAAFLAARYGLGVLVSLGNMLVMTWWIGPHAYGLFVTAAGLITFLGTLGRMGVDVYLIRCEITPDARAYGVATGIILTISTMLAMGGVALVPLLARWFGNQEFVAPYLALLLTIPITALTGVPTAKLERALNYSGLAGVELGGQCLGLLVALAAAWHRLGVWAPVAGYASWQAFILVGTYRAARLHPRVDWGAPMARAMLAYGIGLTASLRAWQMRTLVNPLLVGRFAGAEGVAFVGLAIRIAESLGAVRNAAGRLAIAALARLRNRHEDFHSTLERALRLQILTLGPPLCGFALLGPFAIRHIIGARWMPSLTVYPFIAAGVLANSVYNLQASALFVLGKQWMVLRAYSVHLALLGAGTFFLLPHFGLAGYGWAELLACGGYWGIHAGLGHFVILSYRRLLPWLGIFCALLFVPLVNSARMRPSLSAIHPAQAAHRLVVWNGKTAVPTKHARTR